MPHVNLDAASIARLAALAWEVEVRDADGKVIGYFRPKVDPTRHGPLEPPISPEEMDRREKEPGPRYTTEQVIEMAKRRAEEQGR